MKKNVLIEDGLKHFHEQEYHQRPATLESLAGVLSVGLEQAGDALDAMEHEGLLNFDGATYSLTDKGREYARQVMRAHRLYETYLAEKTGVEEKDWHRQAEIKEHILTDQEVNAMAQALGHPRYDPHGDPIPTISGMLPDNQAIALENCIPGWIGKISHIEDEPEGVYQEIVRLGIFPGMFIKVLDNLDNGICANIEGRNLTLTRGMMRNIMVLREEQLEEVPKFVSKRLSDLKPGESADIVRLSQATRGAERARLLDLGVVPGSKVKLELQSAFRSPRAYRIRGTLIALRKEQAEQILIEHIEEVTAS